MLNVRGEELPKVIHYYKEPHPYYDHDVMVVGAKNSAAIAALELFWTGARVTLVHRGPEIHRHVKYWIKPNIENRIKNGEVKAYFNSHVVEIHPKSVILDTPEGRIEVKNDFVLAMIGYSPDMRFLNATRHHARPRLAKAPHQPRYSRKRAQRHLPRGRDRSRHAHQRNLHRKRPLPRRPNRPGDSPRPGYLSGLSGMLPEAGVQAIGYGNVFHDLGAK